LPSMMIPTCRGRTGGGWRSGALPPAEPGCDMVGKRDTTLVERGKGPETRVVRRRRAVARSCPGQGRAFGRADHLAMHHARARILPRGIRASRGANGAPSNVRVACRIPRVRFTLHDSSHRLPTPARGARPRWHNGLDHPVPHRSHPRIATGSAVCACRRFRGGILSDSAASPRERKGRMGYKG